jgi:hypothetical protein
MVHCIYSHITPVDLPVTCSRKSQWVKLMGGIAPTLWNYVNHQVCNDCEGCQIPILFKFMYLFTFLSSVYVREGKKRSYCVNLWFLRILFIQIRWCFTFWISRFAFCYIRIRVLMYSLSRRAGNWLFLYRFLYLGLLLTKWKFPV